MLVREREREGYDDKCELRQQVQYFSSSSSPADVDNSRLSWILVFVGVSVEDGSILRNSRWKIC